MPVLKAYATNYGADPMKPRLIIQKSASDLGINNACAAVIDNITVSDDRSFMGVLQNNLNHVASHLNNLNRRRL